MKISILAALMCGCMFITEANAQAAAHGVPEESQESHFATELTSPFSADVIREIQPPVSQAPRVEQEAFCRTTAVPLYMALWDAGMYDPRFGAVDPRPPVSQPMRDFYQRQCAPAMAEFWRQTLLLLR